ncbi:MAG: hypothetical protein Q8N84_00630, partial [bacterium]|nr:hypothetical protein [bacterium]
MTRTMFCKYCGKLIDGNSVYCSDCGKQLNSEAVKTKDKSDSPVESSVKPKFSLLELSLVKLLGFTLILSAAAVIGGPLLSGISLSNAVQPPFLLIPIIFILGLCVIIPSSYNLALSVGLTFFSLVIYFMPSP